MAVATKTTEKIIRYSFGHRPWTRALETEKLMGHRTLLNIHRGGGKSWYACHKLIMAAVGAQPKNGQVHRFLYVGMSISHAVQTAWEVIFASLLHPFVEAGLCSFNGNEHKINFFDPSTGRLKSQILLSGYDTPEKNRGMHVHGLVLDEAQGCDEDDWSKIFNPTTVQNNAWVIMVGTPNGPEGLFYKTWLRGNDPENIDWVSITRTIDDTNEFDESALRELKSTSTEAAFQQEYYCSFDAAVTNRVYYNYTTANNKSVLDRQGRLHVGLDFNVTPMVSVIGQLHNGVLEVINEIVQNDTTTDAMCRAIRAAYPNREIIIYPDASGAARSTATMDTNHSILRRYGFRVVTPRKNPAVKDRIHSVNVLLKNASGISRLFINPETCPIVTRTLRMHQKSDTGLIDKKGGLDHAGDALGYLVYHSLPLQVAPQYKKTSFRI